MIYSSGGSYGKVGSFAGLFATLLAHAGLPWRALGWWSNGELTGSLGAGKFTARDPGVASVGWCWACHGTWLCPCLRLGLVVRGSWGVRAPCPRREV